MRKIYFLLIILLFGSCNNNSLPITEHESPEYVKMADRITAKVVQKLEKEIGLTFAGIGGGMMNQINMMAISFNYRGELNIEQGRELLVYCVKEYLAAINENIEIRPYLVHYPFTPKEIQIAIFIRKPDGKDVSRGTLSVISEVKGILEYDIRDPFTDRLTAIHEETHEEAIKTLETSEPINKVRKKLFYL